MSMLRYLNPFTTDHIPAVLLTGNGLHRAFNNEDWDCLLKELSANRFTEEEWEAINKLSYPQRAIIATSNSVLEGIKSVSDRYIQASTFPGEDELVHCAVRAGFETILTTNYSYEIEKALCPEFHVSSGKASRYRKKTCSNKPRTETDTLYQYMLLPVSSDSDGSSRVDEISIWHIHGEAARPGTMIIGHYYYGRVLSVVRTYIKETIKRYKYAERRGELFYPRSWVDYILFGNVYIIGQGMDQSEMDLWWLMDCKKLHGKGSVTLYKPEMPLEQIKLAEACGVRVEQCDKPQSYVRYYEELFHYLAKSKR